MCDIKNVKPIVKNLNSLMTQLDRAIELDDYQKINEIFGDIKKGEKSLIQLLSIQEKTNKFFAQMKNPFREKCEVFAAGFGYKVKKFGKDLKVQGRIPSHKQLQKEGRLYQLEIQRLKELSSKI